MNLYNRHAVYIDSNGVALTNGKAGDAVYIVTTYPGNAFLQSFLDLLEREAMMWPGVQAVHTGINDDGIGFVRVRTKEKWHINGRVELGKEYQVAISETEVLQAYDLTILGSLYLARIYVELGLPYVTTNTIARE